MSLQKFISQVVNIEQVSKQCNQLTLQLIAPKTLDFKAGQHVIMDIPGIEAKRSYSIASSPKEKEFIQLLVDIRPGGPGSAYLASAKVKDQISFFAPAGQFLCEQWGRDSHLVFIATGSGICPLKSMISSIVESDIHPKSIQLLWGIRNFHDAFWISTFDGYAQKLPTFTYSLAVSRATEMGSYLSGRVTQYLSTLQTETGNEEYYVCGSKEMIATVKTELEKLGVNQTRIHWEKFY